MIPEYNSISGQSPPRGKISLYFGLVGFGLYPLAVQILSLREFLVIYFGNELCLGVILSGWFAGISLGAFAALMAVKRWHRDLAVFTILTMSFGLILPVQIVVIRNLRGLLAVQPGMNIPLFPLMLQAFLIMLPASFLVGFIFPFACRLAWQGIEKAASSVGLVYALEAVGSLLGGLLLTYLFIGRLPVLYIVICFNLILGLLLLVHLAGAGSRWLAGLAGLFLLLNAAAMFTGLAGKLENRTILARWKHFSPAMAMDESLDTPYQNITVSHMAEQYSVFGNGQLAASFPDRYATESLGHLIMCQHPGPKNILLMGDCSLEMLAPVLAHGPERVDYVELDPGMIGIQQTYQEEGILDLLAHPSVRIHLRDARLFMQQTDQSYDLIISLVPDPATAMLNRYYTTDFFREVKARLREGGVAFFKIRSAVNYFGEEVGNYAASVYRSLRTVFPEVLVAPGEYNYFFASTAEGTVNLDTALLAARFEERGIRSDYFAAGHFHHLFSPMAVAYTHESLETRFSPRLNTDKHPVTYFFNLLLWDRFSGGKASSFFLFLYRLDRWYFFLPLFVLLFIRSLALLRKDPGAGTAWMRRSIGFSIATTGFSAIALEIVFIFLYQNIFGYLYHRIGLIVALFMFGLFLGSILSPGIFKKGKHPFRLLICCEIALFLLALFLSPLADVMLHLSRFFPAVSEPLFMMLFLVVGIIAGSEFPLAAGLYPSDGRSVARVSAVVDSADHLGACAGAMITGVILMPLLGILQTGLLLALLKASSLVPLLKLWKKN